MIEKPTFSHTLGITLNNSTLKAAALSIKKGKPFVEKVTTLKLETENANVKRLDIDEVAPTAKNSIAISGLNTRDILIRPLEVKLTKERDIDAVYQFQSEPLLPYPLENAVVDKMIIGKTEQGTLLSIIAARSDHLQQHLEQWKPFEIEPEVVSCVPAALAQFAKECIKTENALYVVHFGMETTSCVLAREGKLLGAYELPIGYRHIVEAFSPDVGKASEEAETEFNLLDFENIAQYPHTAANLDELEKGILKSCYALSKYAKGREIEDVLVTGYCGKDTRLASFLCKGLNKRIVEPKNDLWNISQSEMQQYAIEIGYALSALPNSKDQINFRQSSFVYSNPWKRYKKPAAIYMALCLLLAVVIYFAGNVWVGGQEDKIREEYGNLLNTMNKPYDTFETEYEKKFPPSQSKANGELLTLKELSQEDLQGRLSYLEKELQNTPDIYPLQPNTPRVSDVLAWLTSHPNVVMKTDKGNEAKLQIESFSYAMVKRPELTKKQEKYQVKIDLEISSPTPMLAREFHDSLVAPNDFVDPKGEIKWNSNRGKYRTSFYLKDKTVYPF